MHILVQTFRRDRNAVIYTNRSILGISFPILQIGILRLGEINILSRMLILEDLISWVLDLLSLIFPLCSIAFWCCDKYLR